MMYKMIVCINDAKKQKLKKLKKKKPMKRMMKRAEKIALTQKGYNCAVENVV